jgi:2,5-furandicarboxylate decarboxylase 1
MPQQSLGDFVADMEKAGLLVRIKEEKRVDELPIVMDENHMMAVYVEKVKDCQFSFLANAYSNIDQFAWALGCDKSEVGPKMAARTQGRVKPEVVGTAPCKEVIVKGKDVDLTILPLFLHHDRDGNAFIQDTNYISADPDTGVPDWGLYRSMFRTKNELNIDMLNETHRCRLHALAWQAKGRDMPVSVVIGGPVIDKLASLSGGAGNPDDWEVLGSFYGAPAQMVKSETNDLLVPDNAEIVLEGRIMTTEGWVHDEGPYGEGSGMYGAGLHHNCRVIIDCITYKKGGIYQHASIGGSDATHTDMGISLAGCAGAMMHGLRGAGLDVLEVRADGPIGETAYAKIRAHSGGDAQRALYVMLTCSGQTIPKIAMVFDEDVDIWNDAQIRQAQAFRFDAARDAVILSAQPGTAIDPMTGRDEPPFICSKLGMDCTIPWGDGWVRDKFTLALCTTGLGEPDPKARQMTEDQIAADMEAFIRQQPRAWKDITARYLAQPYPLVYRAFGRLRPRLGRVNSSPWFPYTFSGHEFDAVPEPAPQDSLDPRHPKA